MRDLIRKALMESFACNDRPSELVDRLSELFKELNGSAVPGHRSHGVFDVTLEVDDCKVSMAIHGMPESLVSGIGMEVIEIYKNEDFIVKSSVRPDLTGTVVYLLGENREQDQRESAYRSSSHEDAVKYYEKLVKLFDELNSKFQLCGHPKSSIRGEGLTHWCKDCVTKVVF